MKDEINAAVTFLIRIIGGSNQLTKQQTDDLQEQITQLLTNKFHNHWHPGQPSKGQAFRCINQININELEQKSMERQRQASFELMNARKKKYIKNSFTNNKSTTLTSLNNNSNSNNLVGGYDVSTTAQPSNYYPFYASSPNTKYYSTSPPQMQQQQTSSSGLFSPNRMSPYRNFNNAAYMNMSKSMIRNLRTSFDSINNATLSHEPVYQKMD